MPHDQLKEALAECASPLVMVTLSESETASRRTELRAFTDGNITTVTNAATMYSMIDGSVLSLVENANPREIANDDFDSLNELVTMKSSESDQLIGVDPDLAFSIAGETVFCPLTGKENATMSYVETPEKAADGENAEEVIINAEDNPSDEEEEIEIDDSAIIIGDDSDEDEDADEDDDSSDEDEEDVLVDVASFSAKARKILPKTAIRVTVYETAEAIDPVVAGNIVNVVNDDTFVVADDKGSNFTVKATDVSDSDSSVKLVGTASSVESATVEVTVAETVDPESANIRLVSLSGDTNSEVAVFVGDKHIGTMYRNRAYEKAADLFKNGQALYQAFKPTLLQDYAEQASTQLAKFGYVPNTIKVQVGDLFQRRMEREVAKATQQMEAASAENVNDLVANFELAFMGLNKGYLQGKNDLVVAIASQLRRAGVVKPEREARLLLARNSKDYIRSAAEHAKVLSTKSADYLSGMTQTLANADFVVSEEENVDSKIENISTSMITPEKPAVKEQPVEVSNFKQPAAKPSNRYLHLLADQR